MRRQKETCEVPTLECTSASERDSPVGLRSDSMYLTIVKSGVEVQGDGGKTVPGKWQNRLSRRLAGAPAPRPPGGYLTRIESVLEGAVEQALCAVRLQVPGVSARREAFIWEVE